MAGNVGTPLSPAVPRNPRAAASRPAGRRSERRRAAGAAYALLAPSLFGVVMFLVFPVLVVVWLSFHDWDMLSPARWAGLANYGEILGDPAFINSLLVTAFFVVIVIPVQTALGVLVASFLTRGLPGSGLFRVIYVLPWISAPLALGVVWKWILAPTDGLLNTIIGHRVEWLTTPALALPSVAAVVIWTNVGYVALFFMAGLLNIPEQLVDAARIDGAGPVSVFWRIKLPLLRPTMFFVLVTSVISVFQLFDQIYALTGGGPYTVTDAATLGRTDVVAMRLYSEAFVTFDMGHAGVIAVVLLVLLVAITIAQQLYFRKRTTYDLS
ncbi:carbohydrate ABC transporter membrane protein 1, CUT1 family [Paramicrobacterium humi]|uniref:Carbohydrate ABC transporter membrane protein 1, CUT1 family n=1 Tax=Paramicrobacterium humi TaxID=640635 RepID=A0A1H4LL63_9MICO|nr:sugar ABC transporter permease [Microbacterium humi]SEB71374.1 carbohydrate ABC transporter membrane protein 1, CUT1 family [Microbacterium humi]